MSTDLELYKVFCEVVKYKNISKTAESLYLSQSAITQSIQKLEVLLGGKVFYRNKTGVELTEEGKNLYEYIKDSIQTMNNAENIFSKYITLEKGKIRIGGGNSLTYSLIFEPLMNFIKQFPNIEITIGSGITDVLMQKLANGELDIVVLNLPQTNKRYSNIEITSLKRSEFAFFASKQYLDKYSINSFEEISNHTLILPKAPSTKRRIIDDYLKKEQIEINPQFEISSTSIIKKMVLQDLGIGFTNVENLKDIIDEVTIIKKIKNDTTQEGIATLKKSMCNKATLELVKRIKEYYK